MRIGSSLILVATLSAASLLPAVAAEDTSGLKDQKEKVSYSLGMNIGMGLKRAGYDVDLDIMKNGIKDVIAGGETKLTEQQMKEVLTAFQKELSSKRDEERKKSAEKNKQAGDAFLAENKKKPGVKTQTVTLGDGTTAEFQYKVINEGNGPMPKNTDTVTVNYKGTLIDGKEFDNSAKHGSTPSRFQVNRVVRGWTEALQMMKTGSKWELYLPASLAYGDNGYGATIEPGATLIFEMELVGVETPQPLTSDIIRVPSADELKKGAKVEVIKPEDIEKAKADAQKKP
ncbi:MAG TPA: FKBP-type peptidyl-prolyl cis-trans isomerase [Methylomirabilota bacterium]|jgi:FKBP-type peptidyl-prolyl cis-trans isomerase FklB|nr:FKBP-type peptidyl-prolyl cis-trans isomerase [Methylomirabilota bacterium]